MKKILSLALILCLCLALASCGGATLSGEPTLFMNANKSFSIELPAEETEDPENASWIINEETDGDILDMTDSAETIRVLVHGVSKAKVSRVASDLEGYKTYASETLFADLLKGSNMKDSSFEVPEFVKNSTAATFSGKKTEGAIVFMETDKSFYAYLIIAAEGGYNGNEKALKTSILSLKELPNGAPAVEEETQPAKEESEE